MNKYGAPSNLYWISCSCLGGVTMGTGAFFYANNFSKYGLYGNGIQGPGVFIILIIVKLVTCVNYYIKTGNWFKNYNSAWKNSEG